MLDKNLEYPLGNIFQIETTGHVLSSFFCFVAKYFSIYLLSKNFETVKSFTGCKYIAFFVKYFLLSFTF